MPPKPLIQRIAERNPLTRAAWYYPIHRRARRYAHELNDAFSEVRMFCMFLGYPRSGHSLVGSLLDAHSAMVISHELDVLTYIEQGFTRDEIFYLITENTKHMSERGRKSTGYAYAVPGQWNGRWAHIHVIGDKRGGLTSRTLGTNPNLLKRLREEIRIPVRIIHVVRNPFDNISTISRRSGRSLEEASDYYFKMADAVAQTLPAFREEEVFHMRHEDLIAQPGEQLARLCAFLGEGAPDGYLDACSKILYDAPSKTREKSVWSETVKSDVQSRMDRYPFLQGYTFNA